MISDQRLKETVSYVVLHGKEAAAKHLGLDTESVTRYIRLAREKGLTEEVDENAQAHPNVLVLDIETTPLEVSAWRIGKTNINPSEILRDKNLLSYAVKWLFEPAIFSDVLTPEEVVAGNDKRIVQDVWEFVDHADIIIAHNGCVAPGHKILKADFTWVNVEDLRIGDQLFTVEEHATSPNVPRKFKIADVLHATPVQRECSEILLEDGHKIIASNDHPWLTRYSKAYRHWHYCNTDDLTKGDKSHVLTKVFDVWETEDSYHAGYLAGFFDADGCLSNSKRTDRANGYHFTVTFTQKDPLILAQLYTSLSFFNFQYSVLSYDRNHRDILKVTVLGGYAEKIRFLGIVNAVKKRRMNMESMSETKMRGMKDVGVVSVTPVGMQTVIGLGTTSKTYIVDGYPCHNTRFDMSVLNSFFILHGIKPPSPYQIIDTLLQFRKIASFTSNKQGYLNQILKLEEKMEHEGLTLWHKCVKGDQDALNTMLRYNEQDIIGLEDLYITVRPWIRNHPNMALYSTGTNVERCHRCNSENLTWLTDKPYVTGLNRYSTYRCDECHGIGASRHSELTTSDRKSITKALPR